MTKPIKKIYCIGGATIDHKLKSPELLIKETSNPISSFIAFGGVARNIAENLAYWTNEVYLQCAVGNDKEGQQLLTHMKTIGVNIDACLTVNNHVTAHYYAVLNPSGTMYISLIDMDIYNNLPLLPFTISWKEWQANSIVFIDTNLPTEIIDHALKQIHNKQITLCIDPVSVSKTKKLPQRLDNVFLIKPNKDEAIALTQVNIDSFADCKKAGYILLDRGVENVVISLGEAGYAIINTHEQYYFQSTPLSKIQDVSGAGDAFIAGILFGLQHDYMLREACQLGNAAALHTLQSLKTTVEDLQISHLQAFIRKQKHAAIF